MRLPAAIAVILLFSQPVSAQTAPFQDKGRWGARLNGAIAVPARYDTVIGFDQTGQVCLACYKKVQQSNKHQMRITTTVYRCNYLNPLNRKLVIRTSELDTTSVFYLGKSTAAQYTSSANTMVVSIQDEKHLVNKNFTQLTFKGYHDIEVTAEPGLYVCEKRSESETIYTGMVDKEERVIVPFRYSNVKISADDSLIIACSAGFPHGTDDIYTYDGKKVAGSPRHIHQANRTYMIQKAFEPERYFLYNRVTGAEKLLDADEVTMSGNDIKLRKKKNWYRYDAVTGDKKPIKQPTHE